MIKAIIVVLYLFLATSALAQNPAPVKLAWTHSTDNVAVTGYNIYRDGKKIGSSPTTAYTDATVAPTTQYSYTVSAFDAAGNESDTSMPYVIKTGTIIILPPGGDMTFTPLTLYYVDPVSGSDGAAGTFAAPWKTPNHAVNCGDVLLVKPGSYTTGQFGRNFGTVSNCPSTTGGIDGAGGIYFATVLCAGDLAACVISTSGSGNPDTLVEWYNGQSNWAISGFNLPTGGGHRSFGIRVANDACGAGFKSHHIAVINTIVSNSMQAFGFNDCGILGGSSTIGADYVAAVGMIVQNANRNGDFQGGICVGAIDFVGLTNWDTNPGTHAFIHNNYGINNQVAACVSLYDGHAFYVDTPDGHGFSQQVVISNNIGYQSTRTCIAMTFSNQTSAATTFKLINNTCFNNNVGTGSNGDNAEINVDTGGDTPPWTITVSNNISYVDHASSSGGAALYALGRWGRGNTGVTAGGTGLENVFKGANTSCANGGGSAPGPACDPGFNVMFNNSNYPSSSPFTSGNFFVNPSFANTVDLLANRIGVPDCTGFTNTTACMGWNTSMGSLAVPSVISDLTANCAQCTGKGFQRPSLTCAANVDYPTWLKGVVYLQASGYVNGATITEKAGLVTKPCGM